MAAWRLNYVTRGVVAPKLPSAFCVQPCRCLCLCRGCCCCRSVAADHLCHVIASSCHAMMSNAWPSTTPRKGVCSTQPEVLAPSTLNVRSSCTQMYSSRLMIAASRFNVVSAEFSTKTWYPCLCPSAPLRTSPRPASVGFVGLVLMRHQNQSGLVQVVVLPTSADVLGGPDAGGCATLTLATDSVRRTAATAVRAGTPWTLLFLFWLHFSSLLFLPRFPG